MLYNFQYLTEETFNRESENLIVCGNGPSLAHINYNLLPNDFDIFRCNQFYQEESYLLGKNIKLVSLNENFILESYATYKKTIELGEYYIENIIVNYLDSNKNLIKEKLEIFSEILTPEKLFGEHKELISYLSYYENIHNKRPTAGIYLTILGAMLGYKNFFLSGIDLMQSVDGQNYVYTLVGKKNSFSISKHLVSPVYTTNNIHSGEFDLQILEFLVTHYKINLFSISEKSPLTQHINLPKKNNTSKNNNLENTLKFPKNINATLDFILPAGISTSCQNNLEFAIIKSNYKRRITRWHRRMRNLRNTFRKIKRKVLSKKSKNTLL